MGKDDIEIESGEPLLENVSTPQGDPSRNGSDLAPKAKALSTAITRVRSAYEQGLERAKQLIEEGHELKKLTAKQETFVQALADGASAAEAYRFAYDSVHEKPAAVAQRASYLQTLPHVAFKLYSVKREVEERVLRDRESAQHYVIKGLQSVIEQPGTHHAARVNALNLLGKYSGLFDATSGSATGRDKRSTAALEAELKTKLAVYLRDTVGVIQPKDDDVDGDI